MPLAAASGSSAPSLNTWIVSSLALMEMPESACTEDTANEMSSVLNPITELMSNPSPLIVGCGLKMKGSSWISPS